MSTRSGDLLDVGVWIALSESKHSNHERATAYWREAAEPPLVFCRVTALGLVRLLCQKTGEDVVPRELADAWDAYSAWRKEPGVLFSEEPPAIEDILEQLLRSATLPSRLWTDVYLVAFAIAGGHRLISFDKDFERFPGLDLLRL